MRTSQYSRQLLVETGHLDRVQLLMISMTGAGIPVPVILLYFCPQRELDKGANKFH